MDKDLKRNAGIGLPASWIARLRHHSARLRRSISLIVAPYIAECLADLDAEETALEETP